MAAPFGNKNGLGNPGGGRPTKKETIWHSRKWEEHSNLQELAEKINTGIYSVRDMFLFKALGGNEKILTIFANKLLADLVDVKANVETKVEFSLTDVIRRTKDVTE